MRNCGDFAGARNRGVELKSEVFWGLQHEHNTISAQALLSLCFCVSYDERASAHERGPGEQKRHRRGSAHLI